MIDLRTKNPIIKCQKQKPARKASQKPVDEPLPVKHVKLTDEQHEALDARQNGLESCLVWVYQFGMWRQVSRYVAKKEKLPHLDLETLYVPSVSYAIELLGRMSPKERASVFRAYKHEVSNDD